MLDNEEQPQNALVPIDVTLSGIVIFAKERQSLNALSPIDVTLSDIVNSVKAVQF